MRFIHDPSLFFRFSNLDRTLARFPFILLVSGCSCATKGEDHPTYAITVTMRAHILVELSIKCRPLPMGTVDTTCPVRVEQAQGKRANARAPAGWWQEVRSGRPGGREGPVQPGARIEPTVEDDFILFLVNLCLFFCKANTKSSLGANGICGRRRWTSNQTSQEIPNNQAC